MPTQKNAKKWLRVKKCHFHTYVQQEPEFLQTRGFHQLLGIVNVYQNTKFHENP